MYLNGAIGATLLGGGPGLGFNIIRADWLSRFCDPGIQCCGGSTCADDPQPEAEAGDAVKLGWIGIL
jgi:hypothetical protein